MVQRTGDKLGKVTRQKTHIDHSLMPPCQASCPLHMDIREYVDLVAQGKTQEALQVIRSGNPFPSICAYVCTHPCEDKCRRIHVDKAVAIRALKRFAVEFGGDSMVPLEAKTSQTEKVAIVGSGPAGLACAYYLRQFGYPVTIFEAHGELGGMLRVGIPQYRLPREVLDVEVQRLIQIGVEIRTNTRVVSLELLFGLGYKAIFITIGAHHGLRLGIEGDEIPGVIDGATFLREVNLGLKPTLGRRVAVVGGGNVAVDAARTAARLGSKKVTIFYRRSRAEMPADPSEIEQALAEGIRIKYLVAPVRIKREEGRLVVTCIHMKLGETDASGRSRPEPIDGSHFDTNVESLITAIGQAPETPENFNVHIGKGSTIQIDPVTLTTNRQGIFAGGDAVTGPATVTEALAAGRLAASRINDYLQHRYPVPPRANEVLAGDLKAETIAAVKKIERQEPQMLSPGIRKKAFEAVEQVYDWSSATSEARRCLRCGMGAEILSQERCATCLTCLRVCPYHVPYLDDNDTIQIPISQCQACGICVAECPAKVIAMRKSADRHSIDEDLCNVFQAKAEFKIRPSIIGFCCQYGLFGTGNLAELWRKTSAGVWIVPVPCVAKVENDHILSAFAAGAEGIFIAGCGEQCSRENTSFHVNQRAFKIKKILAQIGLEPERLRTFFPGTNIDLTGDLDKFIEAVSGLFLVSILEQEVKE
ncbi:FAD-dependent oxidoreductase [Chloroflexota bacterium]